MKDIVLELLQQVEQDGNLAEWIVDGEPTIDMLGVEPRRYGDYATKSYLKAKNEEAYSHVFISSLSR